jgi:ATP-dependent Clp protease ATP-binding subunit ClpA
VPFTPSAEAALERSSQESLRLAQAYIGTEHLLMGLLAENNGIAVRILDAFDIEPAVALAEVQRLLGAGGTTDPKRRKKGYARPRGRIRDWFSVPPSQPVRRLLVTAAGSADVVDHREIELDDLLGAITSYAHADVLSEFGVDAVRLREAIERERRRAAGRDRGPAQPGNFVHGPDEDRGSLGLEPNDHVRRVLMAAGTHASDRGQVVTEVSDVLFALARDRQAAGTLSASGVDTGVLQTTIEGRYMGD